MQTFEAIGNSFCISPVQKKLACRGSSNSETVCFKMDRYAGKADLSGCHCTVKTKDSEGNPDLAVPEVTSDDKKLYVSWTLSSASTAAAGRLLVQIQFEKIFDDSSKNINWQSNVMEFEIPDSLDAADEVHDQNPTLFQQWEEKVNTAYSDVSASVQSVQALQAQTQADAGAVAQQKQSVEQAAARVSQNAQDAAESARSAATSADSARQADAQAQASAADAQTSQGLAKGYSDAAKTYSDAAEVSAQNAQRQADTAQEAAAQAQQEAEAFSGYTRQEINDNFAGAFLGEKSGGSVLLDDAQAGSDLRSLTLLGNSSGVSDAVITVCGKNLMDYTKAKGDGVYDCVTLTDRGFIMKKESNKLGSASIPVFIKSGTTFSISADLSKNPLLTRGDIPIVFMDDSGKSYYNHMMFSTGYQAITAAADYRSLRFYLETKDADGSEVTVLNPQLELGSEKTAYEPYRAQASYTAAPSAPLMSGESYELVSGVETHSQAVYQHPAQQISAYAPNATILTSAGAFSVRYCRDSNAVLRKIQAMLGQII